eukprot:TRINITY_DN13562_c3_g1_i1.p1 TRINITY_DN13562_c3_g1~~TRINITY_DN13562_c3_g1_i1.p1  ORF type:complete len:192 (-),score=6.66 TRINITY_DN13562_c3_g1_i1:475-1050(-)
MAKRRPKFVTLTTCIRGIVSIRKHIFIIYIYKVHSSMQTLGPMTISLKRSNSPGPDGFTGAFFSATWEITGNTATEAIQHFLKFGKLYRPFNAYFIALIPKISSPSTFSNIRPISLTYKILSKILANRLSKLPPLTSSHQAAFIKGMSIHHHIAMGHELYQKLNSKIKDGSICLKLDTTKAFDKLNWDFLF